MRLSINRVQALLRPGVGRSPSTGTSVHLVYERGYFAELSPTVAMGWQFVDAITLPGKVIVNQSPRDYFQPAFDSGITRCSAGRYDSEYTFAFFRPDRFSFDLGVTTSVSCVGLSHSDPRTEVSFEYHSSTDGYTFAANAGRPSSDATDVTVTTPNGAKFAGVNRALWPVESPRMPSLVIATLWSGSSSSINSSNSSDQ